MTNKPDLIRRSALLAQFPVGGGVTAARARRAIERAENVDAVEVVRCKDCGLSYAEKYSDRGEWGIDRFCHANQYRGYRVSDDHFCSFGIRKEEHNGEDD